MNVREFYIAIDGDINDLLTRIPREDMVAKFIRKYANNVEYVRLFEAYEKKDIPLMFEIAHNLKGMSANMSFSKIYQNLCSLCEAVRNQEALGDVDGCMAFVKSDYELLQMMVAQLEEQ